MAFFPEDGVRVTNLADHPAEFYWNSRRWIIPPGEERVVQVEAVITRVGDPRAHEDAKALSMGEGPTATRIFIPSRVSEVARIRQLFGFTQGPENIFPENDPAYQHLPNVKVIDDDGTEWVTVLDDPIGNSVGIQDYVSPDLTELAKIVERQQRQLNLQAKMLSQAGYTGPGVGPEDTPTSEAELPRDEPQPTGEDRTPKSGPTFGGARPDFPAVPLADH